MSAGRSWISLSLDFTCQANARRGEIVSDGSRHEPFCTVLPAQVSESIAGVQIEEKECF
jgi:hypothetical protein